MKEKEFNLLYEPWIWVSNDQNQVTKLSLLEVFKKAHLLKAISGELPTQDIAIMRLLLAIMHSEFTKGVHTAKKAIELWKWLWDMKKFPYERIESYLKEYEERFWLFHPQHPFYQVVGMREYTELFSWKLIGDIS